MGIAFLIMRERGAMGITEKLDLRIVSLPLEEGAPKGRIGHQRYEREREGVFQVRRL